MAKPQGTYLRMQKQASHAHHAERSRRVWGLRQTPDMDRFFAALAAQSQEALDASYRAMASMVDKLKKGEPLAEKDQRRALYADALEQVRSVCEQQVDLKKLEGRLQVPIHDVIRAPQALPASGIELGLIIALCQVLEVLVRLRGKARPSATAAD